MDTSLDTLGIWSAVAMVLRILAISILIYIARLQLNEFKYKSSLQPLKRLLFYFVIVIAVSNIPILYLHYERIKGLKATNDVTAFATVTNAAGMLIIAVLLYLVYKYRGGDDE